jgi:hypothetical protein
MSNRAKMLIASAPALPLKAVHAAEPKLLVFDVERAGTSIECATNGPQTGEGTRLAQLDRAAHQGLTQPACAAAVDLASVAARANMRGGTGASWARALDRLVKRYRSISDNGIC